MKNKLTLSVLLVVLAAACGRDRDVRADQKNYEVVEEGSASGVTSTIQGPGETLPPITGTNADTTTAFTIDPNAVAQTPQQAPGTIAGTLPPPMTSSPSYPPTSRSYPSTSPSYPSQPQPRPAVQPPAPQQPPPSAPPEQHQPQPPPQQQPPPPTDTAAPPPPTTTTQPPPPPTNEPQEEEEEEEEEEEPPPPPPTTTDTRGH